MATGGGGHERLVRIDAHQLAKFVAQASGKQIGGLLIDQLIADLFQQREGVFSQQILLMRFEDRP